MDLLIKSKIIRFFKKNKIMKIIYKLLKYSTQ